MDFDELTLNSFGQEHTPLNFSNEFTQLKLTTCGESWKIVGGASLILSGAAIDGLMIGALYVIELDGNLSTSQRIIIGGGLLLGTGLIVLGVAIISKANKNLSFYRNAVKQNQLEDIKRWEEY